MHCDVIIVTVVAVVFVVVVVSVFDFVLVVPVASNPLCFRASGSGE